MHSQPYFSNANKLCCAFQSRIGNPTSKTWGSAFIFISHSRYSKEQLLYKIQFNQDKALDHWTYDLPRAQKEVTGIFIGTSEQSTAPCTVCTLGDIGNQRDLLHPMSAASKSLYCLCIWCCEQLDFKTMEQPLFWWVPLRPAQPAWQSSKRRNPSGNRSLAGGYKYLISLLRSCTGETREPITKIILASCLGLTPASSWSWWFLQKRSQANYKQGLPNKAPIQLTPSGCQANPENQQEFLFL